MLFAIFGVGENSDFQPCSTERETSRDAVHIRAQFPQENRVGRNKDNDYYYGGFTAENLMIPVGCFFGTPNEFQARWSNFGRFSTASIPRPHARVRAAKLSAREICFRRSRSNGAEVACRGVLSENICPYSVQPNSQPVRNGKSWFSYARYMQAQ